VADNPVGYWRLGEASGTVAADLRGAHQGTYAYNPGLAQPGALFNDPGTSVGFDGTTQFLQAPSDATTNTATFSFEIWVRPTGGGGYRGVITDRFYPRGYNLYLGTSGAWELWINSGSGMAVVGGGASTLNAWHHVAGTFDGTTAVLYVNGVQVASGPISGYQPQAQAPFEIGQGEWGSNSYFTGQLQEAAIYTTALSTAQIQHHYSLGTTGR
jgi:hypothetical protein